MGRGGLLAQSPRPPRKSDVDGKPTDAKPATTHITWRSPSLSCPDTFTRSFTSDNTAGATSSQHDLHVGATSLQTELQGSLWSYQAQVEKAEAEAAQAEMEAKATAEAAREAEVAVANAQRVAEAARLKLALLKLRAQQQLKAADDVEEGIGHASEPAVREAELKVEKLVALKVQVRDCTLTCHTLAPCPAR